MLLVEGGEEGVEYFDTAALTLGAVVSDTVAEAHHVDKLLPLALWQELTLRVAAGVLVTVRETVALCVDEWLTLRVKAGVLVTVREPLLEGLPGPGEEVADVPDCAHLVSEVMVTLPAPPDD